MFIHHCIRCTKIIVSRTKESSALYVFYARRVYCFIFIIACGVVLQKQHCYVVPTVKLSSKYSVFFNMEKLCLMLFLLLSLCLESFIRHLFLLYTHKPTKVHEDTKF